MKAYAFIVIICSVFISCKQKEFSSADELNRFIADPDNNLRKQTEINGYNITVTYRPTDLLVEQEIGEHPAKLSQVDSLRKKYGNYYYFILSLSAENREALSPGVGLGQYSDLVQTLSFRMDKLVTMTSSSSDTIPVADFALNRTYGMSQSTDVLFVFNAEKSVGMDWVQFNLNEFGLGVGNQRFRFKVEDLQEAPKLKFAGIEDIQ